MRQNKLSTLTGSHTYVRYIGDGRGNPDQIRLLMDGAGEQLIPGKPGCKHLRQFTGASLIARYKPGFFDTHKMARFGHEWSVCAEPDCGYARCVCTDRETAEISAAPIVLEGRAYITVRQAVDRMGRVQELSSTVRISVLINRGELRGVKVVCANGCYRAAPPARKGGVVWLVEAESLDAYIAQQEAA